MPPCHPHNIILILNILTFCSTGIDQLMANCMVLLGADYGFLCLLSYKHEDVARQSLRPLSRLTLLLVATLKITTVAGEWEMSLCNSKGRNNKSLSLSQCDHNQRLTTSSKRHVGIMKQGQLDSKDK